MCGAGHPLQDFGHIRQPIVGQMRQRTGTAIKDALHVIEHQKDHLVFLADVVQIQPAAEVAIEHFIQ
ncbi:hypothetical protein D3C71_2070650 [compost metagenome]